MNPSIKSGIVVQITHTSPVTYTVQLDKLNSIKILHPQLKPRPEKLLTLDTKVFIYAPGGVVRWAGMDISTFDEAELGNDHTQTKTLVCKVVDIDRKKGIVSFKPDQGNSIRMRLPLTHNIWDHIQLGREFTVEVRYTSEYDARYTVQMPASKAGTESQKQQESNTDNANQGTERPQHDQVVASQIGIDPEYFAERQKEGHRKEIMTFLESHLRDNLIEWYRMRPKKDAVYASPQKGINPTVESAIKGSDNNFKQLFAHQAKALDSIRAGRNLIVVTQTASGKTLCYNPAIFEHFVAGNPSAHALYIFPLNALMTDQKGKIDQLCRSFSNHGISIRADMLKGGIERTERHNIAKENPQIIVTNPEMLSVMLNEPSNWQKFFATLAYVVIDEVHTYRGILGLHMAGILRRLMLQTRRAGSQPQFILSSATVGKPEDLAARLTSIPNSDFDLLRDHEDGSAQAYKHWVVANPDAYASGNAYDNYLITAATTMLELLTIRSNNNSNLNTILFAKSIKDVNKIHTIIQNNLFNHPELRGKVRKYVSAELSLAEKSEIYQGLKSGTLKGVVSTNALGAGIDIGSLDACIIAGFPFSVMDMRQMAGRVGRQDEGLVIYVPKTGAAVDEYYRVNPIQLLEQKPEDFAVDPSNPYIARKYINAAAYSLNGLTGEELAIFGVNATKIARKAIIDRVMSESSGRFFGTKRDYKNKQDPYAISGIRSQAQIPYVLCKAAEGQCQLAAQCLGDTNQKKCDHQVAIQDRQYLYRDCHPGAIYESPDGTPYYVNSLDDKKQVAYVETMADNTLQRTFVEQDISIRIIGEPLGRKPLTSGTELNFGEVEVTRSFTGYYTYELIPKRTCRRCRRDYEENVATCPTCGRKTSHSYGQSKPKRQDFPEPFNETGFRIVLNTMGCWLSLPAEVEGQLYAASPCKLPGDHNKVAEFLKSPLQTDRFKLKVHLNDSEKAVISDYHQAAGASLRKRKPNPQETILYPGIYGQCLISPLRTKFAESRTLDIFEAATGYPVTDQLKHVCRGCQTSVLLQALHTLEHTVLMRYPAVALGDISDLGSFSRLAHPDTSKPTVFWYDNYDGGLGSAEKIYERFDDLLTASEMTVSNCTCQSLEGCPNCTHIGQCDRQNEALGKIGLRVLIALLQGKQAEILYEPFVYRQAQRTRFESAYRKNEYVEQEHGIGEEAPASQKQAPPLDAYKVLRVRKEVHDPVLEKAHEVRGEEISNEVPRVSVVELNQAYLQIVGIRRPMDWNIQPDEDPFKILELLPSASLKMINSVRRVIAFQIHPDRFAGDKSKADEMMKLVNEAYDKARKEKFNE